MNLEALTCGGEAVGLYPFGCFDGECFWFHEF